jgi:hypothetical protein
LLFSIFSLIFSLRALIAHHGRLFTIYPDGIKLHNTWRRNAPGPRLHWSEVKTALLLSQRVVWDQLPLQLTVWRYDRWLPHLIFCFGLPQPEYWQDLIRETKQAYLEAQKDAP